MVGMEVAAEHVVDVFGSGAGGSQPVEPGLVPAQMPRLVPDVVLVAADTGVEQDSVSAGAQQIGLDRHDNPAGLGAEHLGDQPVQMGRQSLVRRLGKNLAGPQVGRFPIHHSVDLDVADPPQVDDLFPVGCVVRIVRIIDARRHGKQAIVVGIVRTRLGPPIAESPALVMRLDALADPEPDTARTDPLWKRVVSLAHRVIDLHDDYPDEWKTFVSGIPGPGLMADVVASTLPLPPEEKAQLLAETDPARRLERVASHLEREVTIAETQRALSSKSDSDDMEPGRRERLLRRRMREIEQELGEADPSIQEAEELRERIDKAKLPAAAREQAERELKRLAALPQHAPDRHLIRTYIEWMADLPWSVESEDKLDLPTAREILDADHHDLEKVMRGCVTPDFGKIKTGFGPRRG